MKEHQKSEGRLLLEHTATLWIGQVAVIAFGVTDTIITGHYSEKSLAILSIATSIYISVFVALMSLLNATLPIMSEMRGGKKYAEIGRTLRQSLYLWGITSLLGLLLLHHAEFILQGVGVPKEIHADIMAYLGVQSWVLPLGLLFRVFGAFNQSLGQPRPVAVIQIMGLVLKIPLSIYWTFGWGNFQGYGIYGCLYAGILVFLLMDILAIGRVYLHSSYQVYQVWKAFEPPNWLQLSNILRIGIPNAIAITVEVTSFSIIALLVARLGFLASASHQIAVNLAMFLYMAPLSLSIATSARTSYWLGAKRSDKVQMVIQQGFKLGVYWVSFAGVFMLAGAKFIPSWYTSNQELIDTASVLIMVLAVYQAMDALQVFCMFLLRSWRVTLQPMFIYMGMLWGLGLTGGYWLTHGPATTL
ncbi:MAG: MATE family efflux transporter, partial [Gammaproteobacteria bacterium]|nr:MATE family efflux transporter [Gammaproteobacteria bacterium]